LQHIVLAYDTAIEEQSPIIGIWHSGGARLAEGVKALHADAVMFEAMIRHPATSRRSRSSSDSPRRRRYGPALTDVVIMAPEGRFSSPAPTSCAASPAKTSTWLRSADRTPITRSRVSAHIVADDELDAYERGRRLSDCSANRAISTAARPRPVTPTCTHCSPIPRVAPTTCTADQRAARRGHPIRRVQAKWAPSMVVRLGRLAGRSVGVLANNPLRLGGCLNSESAEKAARLCGCATRSAFR